MLLKFNKFFFLQVFQFNEIHSLLFKFNGIQSLILNLMKFIVWYYNSMEFIVWYSNLIEFIFWYLFQSNGIYILFVVVVVSCGLLLFCLFCYFFVSWIKVQRSFQRPQRASTEVKSLSHWKGSSDNGFAIVGQPGMHQFNDSDWCILICFSTTVPRVSLCSLIAICRLIHVNQTLNDN